VHEDPLCVLPPLAGVHDDDGNGGAVRGVLSSHRR
jgi:hypothetical protein